MSGNLQMGDNFDHTLLPCNHPEFAPCIMSSDVVAAVYSYPYTKFPVCLVIDSHFSLIPALGELLDLMTELDRQGLVILKIQELEDRVEFHFDELDQDLVTLLLSFMSSKSFCEFGNWAFVASDLNPKVLEIMKGLNELQS